MLKLNKIILILFLCLLSCKSADLNPTTTILKHVLTNGGSK